MLDIQTIFPYPSKPECRNKSIDALRVPCWYPFVYFGSPSVDGDSMFFQPRIRVTLKQTCVVALNDWFSLWVIWGRNKHIKNQKNNIEALSKSWPHYVRIHQDYRILYGEFLFPTWQVCIDVKVWKTKSNSSRATRWTHQILSSSLLKVRFSYSNPLNFAVSYHSEMRGWVGCD